MNLMDRLDTSEVMYACAVYAVVFDNQDFDDIRVAGVLGAVAALYEKERFVLDERLRQCKTLETIGVDMGVCRERVRQIEASAIRKLRRPKVAAAMRVSTLERRAEVLQTKVEALTAKNAALAEQDKLLRRSIKAALDGAVNIEPPPPAIIPIGQLDLSVRAYNCLIRAGFRTTDDILAVDRHTLSRVRNLGYKTASEIIAKMRVEGYTEWADGITRARKQEMEE